MKFLQIIITSDKNWKNNKQISDLNLNFFFLRQLIQYISRFKVDNKYWNMLQSSQVMGLKQSMVQTNVLEVT